MISARILVDPPGWIEAPARLDPHVVVHVGPSVHIGCDRGGKSHRGIGVHGDIDIVPAGTPSLWRIKEKDTALLIRVPSELLVQTGGKPGIDLFNRFQIRDPQIEHIAWAVKAEMEADLPGGPVYLESLGVALAASLLSRHSSMMKPCTRPGPGPSGRCHQTAVLADHYRSDQRRNPDRVYWLAEFVHDPALYTVLARSPWNAARVG